MCYYTSVKTCTFAKCEKKILARGFCTGHYAQWRRGEEMRPLRGINVYEKCIVKNCKTPHAARGYCKKHWRFFVKYNLDPEIYEDKLEEQGRVCAICKKECKSGVALSLDHDHSCCENKSSSCGKCVRGLLCYTCNMGIGFLQDNVDIMKSAIEYLNFYNKSDMIKQ